jgi:alkaline phosphatase D
MNTPNIYLPKSIYWSLFFISLCMGCSKPMADEVSSLTIAFGSCADQRWQQPIWNKIANHQPDLFIFMGDNVYIDSADPVAMQQAYKKLGENPNFKAFAQSTPIIATWDDHDYGLRDGGKDFLGKHAAKSAFIDFFAYPEITRLKDKDQGIYHSFWSKFGDNNIQFILLDTRWYRDPMMLSNLTAEEQKSKAVGPYQPHTDSSATLLGARQWRWLKSELDKPADFRVLVSSVSVLSEFTGWDSWANYPHERDKLLSLLAPVNHGNLIIISGDIHKAQISQREFSGKTFVEVASSGLDAPIYPASPNRYRVGSALLEKNFGLLTLTEANTISASASLINAQGKIKFTIPLGVN